MLHPRITGGLAVCSADGTVCLGDYVSEDSSPGYFFHDYPDNTESPVVTITPGAGPQSLLLHGYQYGGQYLGVTAAVQGQANLQTGSPNYAYIGPVGYTDPGSPPQQVTTGDPFGPTNPSESSIWFIDPATNLLSYTYVNPPGFANDTSGLQLVYTNDGDTRYFAITGDLIAYTAEFPGTTAVSFKIDPSFCDLAWVDCS